MLPSKTTTKNSYDALGGWTAEQALRLFNFHRPGQLTPIPARKLTETCLDGLNREYRKLVARFPQFDPWTCEFQGEVSNAFHHLLVVAAYEGGLGELDGSESGVSYADVMALRGQDSPEFAKFRATRAAAQLKAKQPMPASLAAAQAAKAKGAPVPVAKVSVPVAQITPTEQFMRSFAAKAEVAAKPTPAATGALALLDGETINAAARRLTLAGHSVKEIATALGKTSQRIRNALKNAPTRVEEPVTEFAPLW